jgi:hypothetical protein
MLSWPRCRRFALPGSKRPPATDIRGTFGAADKPGTFVPTERQAMNPYAAEFDVGCEIRILNSEALNQFMRTWQYHNPLQPEQVAFAGKTSRVVSIGFYHGGDPLYVLEGVPGVWHEPCLSRVLEMPVHG